METPTPGVFVVALAISTGLSLLVFSHASRHRDPHATAWGIAAFVLGAVGALVYYLRFWARSRRR